MSNTTIPVYINNRNRLSTTSAMVDRLKAIPRATPIIVDNASEYPPLLDWYAKCDVEVVYRNDNRGAYAPWELPSIARGAPFYVVSDSDLDITGVPGDVLRVLESGLNRHPRMVKAGLSLELSDLPAGTPDTAWCLSNESRYWTKKRSPGWWRAPVDTTFAMYRASAISFPGRKPAIRSDRPYTARHVPWYRIMDEEERFVESHSNMQWSSSLRHWAGVLEPSHEQQHPDTRTLFRPFLSGVMFSRILEIGTGAGGFSAFLSTFAPLLTYDIVDRRKVKCGEFRLRDALACPEALSFITAPGRCLVLCDGGNKIAEWEFFRKHIKVGDYIMAHDYAPTHAEWDAARFWRGVEITDSDVSFGCLEKRFPASPSVAWLCAERVTP